MSSNSKTTSASLPWLCPCGGVWAYPTEQEFRKMVQLQKQFEGAVSPSTALVKPVPPSIGTGMRNILVHDYDEVDETTLWTTAEKDLPALIVRLEGYLAQQPPPAS